MQKKKSQIYPEGSPAKSFERGGTNDYGNKDSIIDSDELSRFQNDKDSKHDREDSESMISVDSQMLDPGQEPSLRQRRGSTALKIHVERRGSTLNNTLYQTIMKARNDVGGATSPS